MKLESETKGETKNSLNILLMTMGDVINWPKGDRIVEGIDF